MSPMPAQFVQDCQEDSGEGSFKDVLKGTVPNTGSVSGRMNEEDGHIRNGNFHKKDNKKDSV